MNSSIKYWEDRQVREQERISEKTQKQIDAQLNRYYKSAMKQVIKDFEALYNYILAKFKDNEQILASDIYKLDKYWQMTAQLKQLCQELGDFEVQVMMDNFIQEYQEIYDSVELETGPEFATISTSQAEELINTAWVGDGKNFSKRVWDSTSELAAMLNEKLIHYVTTGKKPEELTKEIMKRFGRERYKADRVVRTEIARIQTESAAKRYEDAGFKRYRILGREEPDKCGHKPDCKDMDGKVFYFKDRKIGVNSPPFHPNCRCRIAAYPDDAEWQEQLERTREKEKAKRNIKRSALHLKEQAKQLREQARALKKQGKTAEAKELEARARALEQQAKEEFEKLSAF